MEIAKIVLEYAYNYGISIDRDVKIDTWDNGSETGTLFIGTGNTAELKWTSCEIKQSGQNYRYQRLRKSEGRNAFCDYDSVRRECETF